MKNKTNANIEITLRYTADLIWREAETISTTYLIPSSISGDFPVYPSLHDYIKYYSYERRDSSTILGLKYIFLKYWLLRKKLPTDKYVYRQPLIQKPIRMEMTRWPQQVSMPHRKLQTWNGDIYLTQWEHRMCLEYTSSETRRWSSNWTWISCGSRCRFSRSL